jgi:hypothetical protein
MQIKNVNGVFAHDIYQLTLRECLLCGCDIGSHTFPLCRSWITSHWWEEGIIRSILVIRGGVPKHNPVCANEITRQF